MFQALGKFVVRFRWLVLIIWLVAVPTILYTLPALSSKVDNNYSNLLPNSSQTKTAQQLDGHFASSANSPSSGVVIIVAKSGELTTSENSSVDSLKAKLSDISGVKQVTDAGISSDGEARELTVNTTSGSFDQSSITVVNAIRATISNSLPTSLSAHFTGQLPTQVDANSGNKSGQKKTQLLTIAIIILLLLIVFRSLLAPFITLIPAGLALAVAEPVIAQSTSIGVNVSFITQLLLIALVLGAGTDYGLFLVFRMREELRKGKDTHTAVVDALTKVGESITFSAATVIAALLCLLLATFGLYKGLGPSLAIGVAIMLLAALTFLPALLAVLGRAVFWPSKTVRQAARTGLWGGVADKAVRHPKLILLTGTTLLILLSFGVIGYQVTGFNGEGAPSNSDSAAGQALISQHFAKASQSGQVLIVQLPKSAWTDMSQVTTLGGSLNSASQFTDLSGPVANGEIKGLTASQLTKLHERLGDPSNLPVQYQPMHGITAAEYYTYLQSAKLISGDGKYVEVFGDLSAGKSGTTAAMNAIPGARNALQNAATKVGAISNGVLSSDAAAYDVSSAASHDLIVIFPIVLAIIMVLLGLLLKSIIAPIYLVLTVALSYFATLGFAMLVFVHSGSASGLNFVLPFMLFIFSMALGEDYNILIMSRIREEAIAAAGHDNAAISKAIGVTGTTVTSAGLILAGTFAVLGFAGGNEQVQQIGYSVAFGILLDTFLVRTLLVPSIATLLGRYNWWPSRLSK